MLMPKPKLQMIFFFSLITDEISTQIQFDKIQVEIKHLYGLLYTRNHITCRALHRHYYTVISISNRYELSVGFLVTRPDLVHMKLYK